MRQPIASGSGNPRHLSRSIGRTLEALLWYARTTRVVVGVLVLVAAGLLGTPQAVDLLITLGQDAAPPAWLALGAGLFWLGLNAWFWSRFILGIRFARDALRRRMFPPAYRRQRALVRVWLPRALGLAPFAIVSTALLAAAARIPPEMQAGMDAMESGAARLRLAAAAIAGLGLVFFYALAMRRTWLRRLHARLRPGSLVARVVKIPAAPRERTAAVNAIRPSAWLLLGASIGVAILGMILYDHAPVATARLLPAAPTILFAAAGMICIGTILVFLGTRSRLPILAALLLFGLALSALRDSGVLADNHDIRTLPAPLPIRPDLAQAFAAFLAASRTTYPAPSPIPVVLVATSGGGLAAAFWTATVLGDLADNSEKFAGQTFAISAVSGGALGALEFTAALAASPPCPSLRNCTQSALSADFLAPTLGAMLYPDLFQRFLPVPLFQDRAATIEQAWEARWRAVFHNNRLAQPFLALWPENHPWPALLLNGTSLFTGGRLVTSNIALAAESPNGPVLSADASDLLETLNADIPASTAANNSARFPYVGPAGNLRRQHARSPPGPPIDAVVDGGYFENFGATSMLDLLVSLDRIARANQEKIRFIVLQLVSDPDIAMDAAERMAAPDSAFHPTLPRGLIGPVATLLRTRGARGVNATENLARATLALGGTYIPIRLGVSPTGASAPLGWALSATARRVIDDQWTETCRDRLLAAMSLDAPPTQPGMTPTTLSRQFMSMLMTPVCRSVERKDGAPPHTPPRG